jgi:ribosomal-protein-alanine N-acetyltransferase
MRPADVPDVVAIERATFPIPWTHDNFLHEIERNPFACNRVARSGRGNLEAYASTWMLSGELRINNLAVREASRGKGIGEALLRNLMELARQAGCQIASLEVRPSNLPALRLYEKLGFREAGRRRGYYTDTHEDALLMRAPL